MGDGLLGRLPDLAVGPAPEFLGHPLEVLVESGRRQFDHRRRLAPVQPGQLGLEGRPALLGGSKGSSREAKSARRMAWV